MFNRDDLERLDRISLEPLRPYIRDDEFFYRRAGSEHYRLLAHLSTLFHRRTIFDIGTHRGDSAIALSLNDSNYVESFDIIDAVPSVRRMRENVSFNKENLFDPSVRERWAPQLLESPLIFLDIDPHEGTREYEFVKWLEKRHYQGLIVLDDIWYFEGMRRNLWYKLNPSIKRDATLLGHWSGTGFVSFVEHMESDLIVEPEETRNWTVVTGYFDLTERPDASPEIASRPSEHYLERHASSTMSLAKNLIVFCEPQNRARLEAMRPEPLMDRTRFVEMEFDDFPMNRYFEKLLETRVNGRCARDPRNTASYYLFCMARFAMMKLAIAENPFGSDKFAWTNICIERMGFKNLIYMDHALRTQREKFSTCHIDFVPKSTLSDLSVFFGKNGCRDPNGMCGRCSLCSGFFTGDGAHMTEVSHLVEKKFVECLKAGFGHSDEQLLALVRHERPELFDCYLGDYQDMVTNYAGVVDHPESPIRNVIRHSLEARDFETCYEASRAVWRAYASGDCVVEDTDLAFLIASLKISETALQRRQAV